ncbi:mucin-5AC-like [Arapaima gigas]
MGRDKASQEYKDTERNVTIELNHGYSRVYPLTYLRCSILEFWNGSVGVTSNLIFVNQSVVPNVTNAVQSLKNSLNDSIVFLDIIPSSIDADVPNTTTSSPTTTTTATTRLPTTSSPTTTTTATTRLPTTSSPGTTSNAASGFVAANRPKEAALLLLPILLLHFFFTVE